jgi:hypothetical protein
MDPSLNSLKINSLYSPPRIVYERFARPQRIIIRATSSLEVTPEDVLKNFFEKSISMIEETIKTTREKYPALLST